MVPLILWTARKHGIADEDMLHAIYHALHYVEQDDGMTMFIGGDLSGRLLEVGTIDSEGGPVIIDADRARDKHLKEATLMPRTLQEIIDQAEGLAPGRDGDEVGCAVPLGQGGAGDRWVDPHPVGHTEARRQNL